MFRVVGTLCITPFKPILLRMPLHPIHRVVLTWAVREGGRERQRDRERKRERGRERERERDGGREREKEKDGVGRLDYSVNM